MDKEIKLSSFIMKKKIYSNYYITLQSKRKHLHKHIKDDPIQHLAMACDVIIKHKKVLGDNDKLLTKHSDSIQVRYANVLIV